MKTTPQAFVSDRRIGGYDDVRRFFGKAVRDPSATSYRPVIAVFAMTALMALAASMAVFGSPFTLQAAMWFISLSMCVLAILKLQDVETFSSMFLGYDVLARRWAPYAYIYPFAEALAGVLMTAGVLTWLSVPVALFIGGIGAVSVFKAVYIDKRAIKCACVGGSSQGAARVRIADRERDDGGDGGLHAGAWSDLMASFPHWLHTLAIVSLALAFTCAVVIALDELRRPQKMWIMYLVWPLTALFGSVLWLAAYYRWGRGPADGDFDAQSKPPFAAMVVKGASHCGAGCTLGDIIAEWAAFAVPAIAVWFGYGSLFADKTSRSGSPTSWSPS